MSTKLTTITTQYRKFNTNQVLTEKQLNEFLDYFEDQHHLSRIGLSGVGIACGFKLSFNQTDSSITITQGYGVTTDGDLIALQRKPDHTQEQANKILKSIDLSAKTYTRYKEYNNEKVKYPRFYDGENQIALVEIFDEDDIDTVDLPNYGKLEDLNDLEDKVVLLYLESYSKTGDLCTALDCDNQGIEQVNKLRVLLISSENAINYIAAPDVIYNEHDWYQTSLDLPEVAVGRDILSSDNTKTFKRLKEVYYQAINNFATVSNLSKGIDDIYKKLNSTASATLGSAITSIFSMSPSAIPLDFQYRYDLLKDLVDTYNEIKCLLLLINTECCPNIGAFQKHLILGRLVEANVYNSLRHRFYKSPIIGQEDENYKRVVFLMDRVATLVNNYMINNPEGEIKITPSQRGGNLGGQAIPFYYNVGEQFINNWSFDKTRIFKQKTNLSYHNANLANLPAIQEPLLFDIDHNNFLRIEGIQGKLYQDALDRVVKIKEDSGLSFDVKILSINATTQSINLDDYNCEFEDLQVLLKAWTTEQDCILAAMASFFSGFSTNSAGENIRDVDYTEARNPNIAAVRERDTFFERQGVFKKNTVEDNLTLAEYTLGFYVKRALDENRNGSINDIKNTTISYIGDQLLDDTWTNKDEVKDFVIFDAVELIAATFVLADSSPDSLSDIDELSIASYELTLEQVCDLVKNLKVTYQTVDLDDTLKDILGLLINQLSFVCCSGEKLTILLEEINLRKERILTQIQLSEFVKKHPGLRHAAGVAPGGTFVMAYLTENTADVDTYETSVLELDFLEQPNIDDHGTDGDEGYIELWNERASVKFAFLHTISSGTQNNLDEIVLIGDSIAETVANLAGFLNDKWSRAGYSRNLVAETDDKKLIVKIKDRRVADSTYFMLFFNPAIVGTNNKIYFDENEVIRSNATTKNTVVADFSLPYMCCSDCSPVNFIVPKEPVFLSLPVPYICLDDETSPIGFVVSPLNGEIRANVSGDLNGGVFQDDNGQYFFDARVVSPSLYGTEITFTVNNEATTASIVVYDKGNPSVTYTISYNEDRTIAIVTFVVTGVEINAATTFLWDLGNGNTSTAVPDTAGVVQVKYELPVNNSNAVSPSLTISNGPCATEIAIAPIIFEDPIVEIAIDGTEFCVDPRIDEIIHIPYTVIPTNAEVTTNGDLAGITFEDGHIVVNSRFFTAYDEPITFNINGQPVAEPIIHINNKATFAAILCSPENVVVPEGDQSVTIDFSIIGLTDQELAALDIKWDFGDGTTASSAANVSHEYDISNQEPGQVIFNVSLYLIGAPCDELVIEKEVNISITDIDATLELDNPILCLDIDQGAQSTAYTLTPSALELTVNDIEGIEITDTKISVYPSTFTAYNTPITFLANGDPIPNASLMVRRRPTNATINWLPNIIEVNEGETSVNVSFKVEELSTTELNFLNFEWSFGDGNSANGATVTHTYNIEQGATGVLVRNVSLLIVGVPCEDVLIAQEITISILEAAVTLSDNDICYERNDETGLLIPFAVSPPEGTVTINENVAGLDVVQNTAANIITMDPTLFDSFGRPITFSVDGQALLEPKLVIALRPTGGFVEFNPSNPTVNQGDASVAVAFTLQNIPDEDFPNVTFNWQFGDTNAATSNEKNPTMEFEVPSALVDTFDVSYSLSIAGLPCSAVPPITGIVTIKVIPASFELNLGTNELCIDPSEPFSGAIPISTSPQGGSVTIVSPTNLTGMTVNADSSGIEIDSALFSPFNQDIKFQVNGNDVQETLVVRKLPSAVDFDWTPDPITMPTSASSVNVTFNATNYSTSEYPGTLISWQIENVGDFTGPDVNVDVLRQDETIFTVTVLMRIEGPCQTLIITKEVVVTVTEDGPPENCFQGTETRILNDRATLDTTFAADNPTINSDVVLQTMTIFTAVLTSPSPYLKGQLNNANWTAELATTIDKTATQLKNNSDNQAVFIPLANYYRKQVMLFYNILHCQEAGMMLDDNQLITNLRITHAMIAETLQLLNSSDIAFDPSPTQGGIGALETYLVNYTMDPEVAAGLRSIVKTQIIEPYFQ